jgi:protocatechuate 3,4-dioxygenase alpha subunit
MTAATAFQTIGPYWHLLEHGEQADLTRFGAAGDRLVLTGSIRDGNGDLVADAAVELWQASPAADDSFPGWGRAGSDTNGVYRFVTVKPGPVPGRGNSQQAPHFAIMIFARGILTRLCTRAYFAGDKRNDGDPLLNLIDDPARRATLMAKATGVDTWRFDVVLQGANETVFLDI